MKRLLIAAAFVLVASACSSNEPPLPASDVNQITGNYEGSPGFLQSGNLVVVEVDGITCIVYRGGRDRGGLSCDWSGQ